MGRGHHTFKSSSSCPDTGPISTPSSDGRLAGVPPEPSEALLLAILP